MRQKSTRAKEPAEKTVRDIRRRTRKQYLAEEKIRIVLEGLRGEDEAHHLGYKLLDELRIIRDRSGCGLALLADKSITMVFARCQQVDGRIGLKIDLTEQAVADVEDIAAGVLGRQPSRAELRTLNAVGRGPGGLHALRRLLEHFTIL